MPVRRLPSNPNLAHLRYQAKDLLKDHDARNQAAAQRIREFRPRFNRATDAEIFGAQLSLGDAQLTIAPRPLDIFGIRLNRRRYVF